MVGINKLSLLGVAIISAWFYYSAYTMLNNTKKYNDDFYKSYGEVYSYY